MFLDTVKETALKLPLIGYDLLGALRRTQEAARFIVYDKPRHS